MTDYEIDSLWMRRTNIHNGELMPQLRDFARAVIKEAVAKEREARFLIVAMEDDGCGTPVYCKDEAAVKIALQPMLFYLPPGESLSDVHAQELDAQAATLLEDGVLSFEGDPPIHLYRLQAIRARGAAHD